MVDFSFKFNQKLLKTGRTVTVESLATEKCIAVFTKGFDVLGELVILNTHKVSNNYGVGNLIRGNQLEITDFIY